MSATLGDVSAIAATLEERTDRSCELILDAPRPVPLSYRFVNTTLEATVKVALEAGEAPLYIVHFAQDAALKSAQHLASFGVSTKEQREQVKDALAHTRFITSFSKTHQQNRFCGADHSPALRHRCPMPERPFATP